MKWRRWCRTSQGRVTPQMELEHDHDLARGIARFGGVAENEDQKEPRAVQLTARQGQAPEGEQESHPDKKAPKRKGHLATGDRPPVIRGV